MYSPVLTGVITPEGIDADALRRLIHQRFDLSLGTGLGKLKGRMFRMGHLGDSNDLTLVAMVAGVEMGMKLSGVKLGRQRRACGDGPFRRTTRTGRAAKAARQRWAPGAHRTIPTNDGDQACNDVR